MCIHSLSGRGQAGVPSWKWTSITRRTGCWSLFTSFWPEGPTPPSTRWCWRGFSWATATCSCHYPRQSRRWSFLARKTRWRWSWGPFMDDVWMQEVPKLKVWALSVNSHACSPILKTGQQDPHLPPAGTVLLYGPRKGSEVYQHVNKAPNTTHSYTKPCVHSKGWKLGHARGRWATGAYKN